MTEKKYPIGGFAPGNYMNTCVTCKKEFMGDKLARQCELCATAEDNITPDDFNNAFTLMGAANDMHKAMTNPTPVNDKWFRRIKDGILSMENGSQILYSEGIAAELNRLESERAALESANAELRKEVERLKVFEFEVIQKGIQIMAHQSQVKKLQSELSQLKSQPPKPVVDEAKLRQLFKNNSNCYADTWSHDGIGMVEGEVVQAMTEDKFIELLNGLDTPRTDAEGEGLYKCCANCGIPLPNNFITDICYGCE